MHWHYSVPSERLTRGTFHSVVRANDTRALGAFTEKKCAALAQPVVVRIVSSFKQLFAAQSVYLHSVQAAPAVHAQLGAIKPKRFSRRPSFLSSNYSIYYTRQSNLQGFRLVMQSSARKAINFFNTTIHWPSIIIKY